MFTEIKTILYQETGYYVSDLAWNSPKDGFAAGRSASNCTHRYGSGCGCRKMGEHHDAHWRWVGGHGWWGDDRDGQTEALNIWIGQQEPAGAHRGDAAAGHVRADGGVVLSLVAALLATREREIQNPRDEANRVAGRKAKLALARELGGEEHIPLAIEIYRFVRDQGEDRGRQRQVDVQGHHDDGGEGLQVHRRLPYPQFKVPTCRAD